MLGCAGAHWTGPIPDAVGGDPERIAADVAWLADDARDGRGLGTRGLAEAAAYLAAGFERAGFGPGGADGSFFQPFEMPVGIRLADGRLSVNGEPLERGRDFDALLASGDAEGDFELVFVGYGISDPESGWDDYAGVDVEGRAVLVLDSRPAGDGSRLAGPRGAGFLARAYKLLNASRNGAAAVLIAPSAAAAEALPAGAGAELPNPTLASAGIPSLAVSRSTAEQIMTRAGLDLAAAQAAIDATNGPASWLLDGVRIEIGVRVERKRDEVVNVVATLPGADPDLAHETVVVGAHYDHLGRGAFGTLAPSRTGEVHNGADDNASGTAGLLALARAFGAGPQPRRSLVLAAFTGEEAGLVGSSRYVSDPSRPEAVAMVNLDMIGRLGEGPLTVFGAESAWPFRDLVEKAAAGSGIPLAFEAGANGPSDQMSFYAGGVPVLFFFTGIHPDYHTPDDDAPKVDAAGEARLLGVVERVTRALLDADERPRLVRTPARPRGRSSKGGYGPYLGTLPAYGDAPVAGVRIQGVSPESPAERAGLRAGDVIVSFDGAPVRSLEEFTTLLFASKAGRRVEVVVEREGRLFRSEATLGQRR
jgi:hypothetical protein